MCDWFHSIKFNGLIDNKDRRDWLHWLRWTGASGGNDFFNSLFIIIIRKESFYGLSIHHSLRSIIIHLTLGISVYLSIESGDVLAMMEIWSCSGIRPTSTAEYKPITLFMVLIEHKSSPNRTADPCWLFYKPYFFPRQRRRFPEEVLISDIGPKTQLPNCTVHRGDHSNLFPMACCRQNVQIQRGLVTHLWEPNVDRSRSGLDSQWNVS